jgi:hypothetical protein
MYFAMDNQKTRVQIIDSHHSSMLHQIMTNEKRGKENIEDGLKKMLASQLRNLETLKISQS